MSKHRTILLSDENMLPVERRFPKSFNRQSTRILYAIRAIAQQVNDEASGWLAAFGLNAATYNYLINLYAATGYRLTQNEIRGFTHTSEATVTQVVRSLERDGLVKRAKNPADARSVLVTLTRKGVRAMEAAAPFHHGMLEAHMAQFTPQERDRLLELLVKLSESFNAGNAKGVTGSKRSTPIKPRRPSIRG